MLYARVVEGSFTANLFYEFIEGLLDRMAQTMPNDSVIVMDNARIHRNPVIANLIRRQ
jgi:hypothetical protein